MALPVVAGQKQKGIDNRIRLFHATIDKTICFGPGRMGGKCLQDLPPLIDGATHHFHHLDKFLSWKWHAALLLRGGGSPEHLYKMI